MLRFIFTKGSLQLYVALGIIGLISGGLSVSVMLVSGAMIIQLALGALASSIESSKDFVNFLQAKSKDMKLLAPVKLVNWASGIVMLVANNYFRNHPNPLIRGDKEEMANRLYPKDVHKYKSLYIIPPEDLKRSLIVDGRTPNGTHVYDAMAPSFASEKLVRDSLTRATAIGLICFALMTAFYHPRIYFANGAPDATSMLMQAFIFGDKEPVKKTEVNNEPSLLSARDLQKRLDANANDDFWSVEEIEKLGAMSAWFSTLLADSANQAKRTIVWTFGNDGNITAIVFSLFVFFAAFRGGILTSVRNRSEYLKKIDRQAIRRYKINYKKREQEMESYTDQLQRIQNYDNTPTFSFGKATGHFRFAGHYNAPFKGQKIKASLIDLQSNTITMGGTGSGKTRQVFIPFMRQILAERAKDRRAISIYGTDDKAAVLADVLELAKDYGQENDVRVIGCQDGEYGLDLLDGLMPSHVATILNSVSKQINGNSQSGDPFWDNSRDNFFLFVTRIAYAHQFTPKGMQLESGKAERVYSIVNIFRMAMSDALIMNAISDIYEALNDSEYRKILFLAGAFDEVLVDEIKLFENTWIDLAKNTKDGILENIKSAFGPLCSNNHLRKNFTSGTANKMMTIGEVWGSITLVNMPEQKYGMAARLVNVFLKTLLFREARRRQVLFPDLCKKEALIFAADEYQNLATTGRGDTDSTFWNISRSTGTVGFLLTQNYSVLEQELGKAATQNLIEQMRSKIILPTEDAATIEFAIKLAGTTMRFYCAFRDEFEGYEAINEELDVEDVTLFDKHAASISDAGPLRLNEAWDNDLIRPWSEFRYSMDASRFMGSRLPVGGTAHVADNSGLLFNIATRFEDKNRQQLEGGVEPRAPTLDFEDFKRNNKAYMHIMRAGVPVQDLIDLPT